MRNKTAIIAPAIKTKFWKDIYLTLNKGNVDFHLVFVGHVRPNFVLPPNFTHIYCELSAAACVEVAYRYVYKNLKDVDYIVNIADDSQLSENFVEELVSFYNQQKEKYNTDLLLVGPAYLMASGEENLMATHNGGPSLLGPAFTTIENSKKIGGVDKRFEAIYWDCDRMLRTHALGGKVIFAGADEITPVFEKEHDPGLYVKYRHVDRKLLDDMWDYADGPDETVCSTLTKQDVNYEAKYRKKRNELIIKKMSLTRKDEVVPFTDMELGDYYE